ncbi:hypothetical protein [Borreliella valaisiana]|uniref:Uncharacterized protein n=1 Tax=Borreliella valaisiana VS116 TaxID=445987 RepID=D6RW58_BORVA|nr:hypothetical protein [Borreliella valaisiana]AIJ30054.1 hypothetical protein P613_03615 [Borreliella valaisiana Tom4006]EEF81901.1 conserved hypothetical protein [Borreliella valaisiana VS116]WKC77324.1 hypothetical protein QIA32_04105 [Borreliella valaisiana]WLN25483.1 hypothetical protein KJD10_03555 [Borreliella valaisiana]WVN14408.1 hypothetical protein KJD09_03590 [Borreliella valaisiana]
METFKIKNLRRFSNFIRTLVIVLFLNSLLSLFVFLAGSYNIFVYNFQKFYLDITIVLSSVSFGLESTRLIFFYLLRNKKINYYLILIFSFMIFFCALVFKIFLSGNK